MIILDSKKAYATNFPFYQYMCVTAFSLNGPVDVYLRAEVKKECGILVLGCLSLCLQMVTKQHLICFVSYVS